MPFLYFFMMPDLLTPAILLRQGILLGALLILCGCASHPKVTDQLGHSPDSDYLREKWLPVTQDAIAHYEALLRKHQIPALKDPLDIQLADDEAARSHDGFDYVHMTLRLTLGADKGTSSMYSRTAIIPARMLAFMTLVQLSGHHFIQIPLWMRDGSPQLLAYATFDQMNLPFTSRDWRADNLRYLRDPANRINLQTFARATNEQDGRNEISGWMVDQLYDRQGERFFRDWADYLQRLAKPGADEPAAFQAAFGISESDFIRFLETRLAIDQTAPLRHAGMVPPPSGYANVANLDKFPLKSASGALDGYRNFLQARPPKAFALSLLGAWGYEDEAPDAMARAMASCRTTDPLGCVLYAVDENVVFTPPAEDQSDTIEVVASTDETSVHARAIREKWLPLVRSLADAFNAQCQARLGVPLRTPTRIYLTPSRKDYTKVLQHDMQMLASEVRTKGSATTGLADSHGMIAVYIPKDLELSDYYAHVVLVTLHELVHTMQSQLSRGYAGFSTPPWLTEGSADLLAARFAATLPEPEARTLATADQRTRLAHAYRLGMLTAPEQLIQADSKAWDAMTNQKDPADNHYESAMLMVLFLESTLGNRFYPALRGYFEAAANKNETPDSAFQKQFGMTQMEFLGRYNIWLKTL